ncbi:glutamate-1-semialdehyde 2,1-aminomutase [Mycoplasma sp. P36-A1]|uniref:glutamate-1-semialdehyde 2,1-aminomutase n=1 Tax=Mycoplasma sp. P36-A1 TaxID=3252900 RepID=UPI003C2B1F57
MKTNKNMYQNACEYMAGGVNSPVRAFNSVETSPIIVKEAKNAYIMDVEDNVYIDYIMSWGPLMLGHAPQVLLDELNYAAAKGFSYGVTSEIEIDMAKMIVEAYPGLEQIRMVNSGTEATMSALRLAKGYTNRTKIIKFEGGYHGHSDQLLVQSGSGALTYNTPTSLGVSKAAVSETLVAKYNNIESVKALFEANIDEIAALIIEPIAGNMGLIPAKEQFLMEIRELCTKYKTVLIFDEVISGFRATYQGATGIYNVVPDMVCFGKIIGAGMPVGAYGASKEIMSLLAPEGHVYQAGTLSGNPLAMHVGLKNLQILKDNPSIYEKLDMNAKMLADGFRSNIEKLNLPYKVVQLGSLITLFFTNKVPTTFEDVADADLKAYSKYHKLMADQGILLPPSQYEAMFLSDAHTTHDIVRTISANYKALAQL